MMDRPAELSGVHGRSLLLLGGVLAALTALGARLVHLQVLAGGEYREAGTRQRSAPFVLTEPRGEILDCHGVPLAFSEPGFDLWVDPRALTDMPAAAELLRGLGVDLEERLASARGSFLAARALSVEQAEALRAAACAGLRLQGVSRRTYPLGSACAHVVGCLGEDGAGLEGLEFAWEDALASRSGLRELGSDGLHRRIDLPDSRERPGLPGARLVLALDASLQRIAFEEMSRAAGELAPAGGAAVIIESATGDVKAIVSWPSYDPAARRVATASAALNRAVQCAFEPGSTFKPFVLSWALERGVIRQLEQIDCEGGRWQALEGRVVHDSRPKGVVPIEDVLVYSSNIGAAKVGLRLGPDRLFECVKAFGFGERTGAGLPGESPGLVRPRTEWSPHTVISVPFGQELAVTPLQLAAGYAALVNGGLRVRPRIIDRLEDESGRVLCEFAREEPARVVSEETSRWVVRALARAAAEGTSRRARSVSVEFGGKTGTAQKWERDANTGALGPSATKVVAWFAGFAPVERPAIVCLVMWDEPQTLRGGGTAAAPVAARILERALVETGLGKGSQGGRAP